jgi:hypothetical protein
VETDCNYCFHFCHCWQQEAKILTLSLSFSLSPYIFVITPPNIKTLSLSEHWLQRPSFFIWLMRILEFIFIFFKNKIINCLARFFSLGLLGNILFLELHNLGKKLNKCLFFILNCNYRVNLQRVWLLLYSLSLLLSCLHLDSFTT